MTSSSSVRSTLSTEFGASGICFLSPRIYMQVLEWLFELEDFEAIDHA